MPNPSKSFGVDRFTGFKECVNELCWREIPQLRCPRWPVFAYQNCTFL